jgi:Zn-dependent peptidase ImmA (M78 family)
MPREHFLAEAIVRSAGAGAIEWADEQVEELAKLYSISREAVVRRLLTFGRTTEAFYRKKRGQYAAEHKARKEAELAKYADKEFRKNPARDAVLDNGRPFVRLVLNNYYQERITLSDVSGYLGVRVRHLPRIEMTIGTG